MKKIIFLILSVIIFSIFLINNSFAAGSLNVNYQESQKIKSFFNEFKVDLEGKYSIRTQLSIYKKISNSISQLKDESELKKYNILAYLSNLFLNEIYLLEARDLGKYCVLDECIPSDVNIEEKDGFYLGESLSRFSDEIKYIYKLSKNLDYLEVTMEEPMNKKIEKTEKIGDIYVKSEDNLGCGGSNIVQTIFDKNKNLLENYNFPEFSSDIKIGNIIFSPTLNGEGGFGQPLDSFNNYKIYKNEKGEYKIFDSQKQFESFLNEQVLNKDKKLYKNYIVHYKKYPGINFFYESKGYDESSIRIVWLGTEKDYINENIKDNGDFYDLELTNKIIGYYGQSVNLGIFDKDGNMISKVDNSSIPFFKMKKLNDNGNYLVYLQDGYEMKSFAEMCKPLVYYYSDQIEKNKLTIIPKKGDYFTKLIPELDKNSSWSFTGENSKITVDGEKYDYLYYSLINVGYKHNADGWIMEGKDIVDFFQDKLTKINLNEKEKNDFIEYWADKFEQEKYYFVSFKYKEELDMIIKLNFEKEIDNEFRLLLDSYELENYIEDRYSKYLYPNVGNKLDKYLIKKFERGLENREVLEWGGVLVRNDKTYIK